MKVLLVSPSWPFTYFSFETVVKSERKKSLVAPLGLITVAALLPPEWDLKLVDRSFEVITEEDWEWAELVMISCMMVQKQDTFRVVNEAKKREKPVVVGGPYPTLIPEELLEAGADLVFKGEAEGNLSDLLTAIAEGRSGEIIQERGKPHLTDSPMPRFELLDTNAYAALSVQTARGCPFECEFCDVAQVYGRNMRYKDPDQVLAELDRLRSLGHKGFVFISDDNFVGSKKRAMELLKKMIPWVEGNGKPFNFITQASVNLGQDKELIDLMTEAMFSTVFVGIESPDEDSLTLSRKHQNVRNPLAESIHNIIANGLTIVGSFMIGFDGERKGIDQRICQFVEDLNLALVMVNVLTAFPNTQLWFRLEREERLLDSGELREAQWDSLNFVPTRPEAEIREEFVNIVDRLFEPSRFLKRVYGYFLTMRPTRTALALRDGKAPPVKDPVKRVRIRSAWEDFVVGMGLVWRWGIVPPYRGQFWRQLIGMRRNNPSRMVAYLSSLAFGENMIHIREMILSGTPMAQGMDFSSPDFGHSAVNTPARSAAEDLT